MAVRELKKSVKVKVTTKITELWNRAEFLPCYPAHFRRQIPEIPVSRVLRLFAATVVYSRSFEPRLKDDLG